MKLIKSLALAVVFTVVGAAKAHASTEVFDVKFSSCPLFQVSVASAVTNNGSTPLFRATLVDPTTNFLSLQDDRVALFIQNTSTYAAVFCDVGLSSTSANGDLSLTQPGGLSTSYGFMVPAAPIASGGDGIVRLNLSARNREGRVLIPFCANNGGTTTVKVNVIQCKP